MRYFIIAGEASGNNYARRLIQELKISDQPAEIKYFGPDADSAVMGFIEVLTKAPALLRRLNACRKKILEYRPDVLILIDYPTFNLKMASYARKHGIKTFYYIAPKVWASREWRIRKIKNNVDRLYVIFPFEKEYFASKGIDAVYLGNPLLDHMQSALEKTDSPDTFRTKFKLGPEPILAILPGSRLKEIEFLLPKAIQIVNDFKDYQWIVSAMSNIPTTVYDSIIKDLPVRVMYGHTYEILRQAEAAIVSSGTATLETAVLNCPQLVCYGGNALSAAIAKKIIKVKYISLPNLILNKAAVHELIQKECEPERLADEVSHLLRGRQRRRSILADYKRLHRLLGAEGATARIARDMVVALTGGSGEPRYKVYTMTPFGNFCIAANETDELVSSAFEEDESLNGFYKNGVKMPPEEPLPAVLEDALVQLRAYLDGTLRLFKLPLHIEGTEFQQNVWTNLTRIPYGTTVSYSELAEMSGNSKAARAVGQANNANPFAIIIPCHRVIGNDGSLVGYAAGLGRKQKLLAMEKSYAPESSNSLF